jgi:hypothetical protein
MIVRMKSVGFYDLEMEVKIMRYIIAILSILLVLLLVGVPIAQAGGRILYGDGDAYERYEMNDRFVYPPGSGLRPYRYNNYGWSAGHYYRFQKPPIHHYRSVPTFRRGGLSRRGGRYGRFGRYQRHYRPGQRRHGRR